MSLIYRILAAFERSQAQRKHRAAARHLARMYEVYEGVESGMLAAIKSEELARRELKLLRGM